MSSFHLVAETFKISLDHAKIKKSTEKSHSKIPSVRRKIGHAMSRMKKTLDLVKLLQFLDLFCFDPQCFLRPQLQILCCYLALYYVKKNFCAWGA